MTPEIKISDTLTPFFRYANKKNSSIEASKHITEDQKTRIYYAYARCVSCNLERFKKEDLKYLHKGINTYFCSPCLTKVARVMKQYEARNSIWREALEKVWTDLLFKPKL